MAASFVKITFGDNIPGYELGDKSLPALLVIQEWWGVNDQIKELAVKLSDGGRYRVVIPDLYKGKVGTDAEEASHLLGALDWPGAVGELKEAVKYLKATGSPKVAAVGFCMGGALSFAAAQHCDIVCAAPFYGTPPAALCQVETIKVPVQAHFGALDTHKGFSDPETAKATVDKMTAAGSPAELFMYDSCDHQFFNVLLGDAGLELINKAKCQVPPVAQAELALQRVLEFFKKHLA